MQVMKKVESMAGQIKKLEGLLVAALNKAPVRPPPSGRDGPM